MLEYIQEEDDVPSVRYERLTTMLQESGKYVSDKA